MGYRISVSVIEEPDGLWVEVDTRLQPSLDKYETIIIHHQRVPAEAAAETIVASVSSAKAYAMTHPTEEEAEDAGTNP